MKCSLWNITLFIVRSASEHLLINHAIALLDLEEALFSPNCAPRISAQPIFNTSFYSPTKNLDCVTTCNTTTNMMIDTCLIAEEVFINSESTFKRSMLIEFWLNFIRCLRVDNTSGYTLVFLPLFWWIDTLCETRSFSPTSCIIREACIGDNARTFKIFPSHF